MKNTIIPDTMNEIAEMLIQSDFSDEEMSQFLDNIWMLTKCAVDRNDYTIDFGFDRPKTNRDGEEN